MRGAVRRDDLAAVQQDLTAADEEHGLGTVIVGLAHDGDDRLPPGLDLFSAVLAAHHHVDMIGRERAYR